MKAQFLIVTNQGFPVHLEHVPNSAVLSERMDKLAAEWGLSISTDTHVLSQPPVKFDHTGQRAVGTAFVSTKRVKVRVDSAKKPQYVMAAVWLSVPDGAGFKQQDQWKFCPDCGCSWLSHLEDSPSLEPEDWNPQPCSECGCRKAMPNE